MAMLLIMKGSSSPGLTDIYQRKDQRHERSRMPSGGLQKYETTLALLYQLSVVERKSGCCCWPVRVQKNTVSRAEEAAASSICTRAAQPSLEYLPSCWSTQVCELLFSLLYLAIP